MKKYYIRDGRAPIPLRESTSRIMSHIKAKNTSPELMLRKALQKLKLKGMKYHGKPLPGKPDIYFPKKKLAIFVNGCFWHRCIRCHPSMPKTHKSFWKTKFDRNIARDKAKTDALKRLGWKVVIAWECDIKKNPIKVANSIKKNLSKRPVA
jgi:DNA mismatch endonuclease, patch repair protein